MVLGGLLASTSTPALAQLAATPFTAYGAGDVIAVNALNLGGVNVANLRAAASGGNVNSGSNGLTTRINEFNQNVGPARADKNAYGRGAAVEAGVLTNTPQPVDINQIILAGLAEAFAPPPTGLVTREIDIDAGPTLFARTGRGEAQSLFDPVYCPVGRPITFGRGFAEQLQLLGGGTAQDGSITTPLLGTSTTAGTDRATTQSRTVTYVIANGDGTFGVVSETRQTLAPIELNVLGSLGGGLLGNLLIEVLGEFGLRTVATGKPGGASVTHLGDPIIRISTVVPGVDPIAITPPTLTLSQIIGQGGISLGGSAVAGLLNLTLGGRPRDLNASFGTAPKIAADGTSAQGAIDLLRVSVPTLGVDVGLFHMEGQVTVPAGGFKCQIPVGKVASVDPVTVGQDFNYVISIPVDAALFDRLFQCDLLNVSVVDTVTTESGNPRIQLLGASAGGVISGNTVTWANLGTYQRGAPPIMLTINARIPTNSGAGVLRDTVNVTAALGNCQGNAADGSDIIQGNAEIRGIANLNGSAITGAVTLVAPNVSRGDLAATGGNSWPLVAGGGFLLAALGLVRLRRRAEMVPVTRTTTDI